ncbi:kinase-like domain-containing protein [Kockovaella imperatae]|uniref:Kinase-like domain-containing protein n=1 Tax=Kockovaella imperatae TaxID=4999 RepID=A0A1Y1UF55_9TREE|nr:kinase-like domain-containing protein [Kockovaella imperatae]ORX36136.1 kinase-like domain-containing protein [Kockovaella imperatae]
MNPANAPCAAASSSRPAYKRVEEGERWFIDSGRIEILYLIGAGAYGCVYLGVDSSGPEPRYRAIKCLQRHGLDARQRHFQRRELALHRLACAHPSIVSMEKIVEDEEHLFVVMDYGEDGDLFSMITDKQRYVGDDELIRNVFLQLLDGVDYLHSIGIAHRDVKPENIVCSEDGERVVLCDFGLATSERTSSEFGCGSSFYIAPECLGEWFPDRTTYPTQPGDVWSLGVILVNLVCGRNPWRIASPNDESFNAFLADPLFLRRILPISNQCLYILTRIFTVDPSERIDTHLLRQLILQVDSFSMDEVELRATHLAAQARGVGKVSVEHVETCSVSTSLDTPSWGHESTFTYDQETPSLRADSGSPSPPIHRSTSSSSNDDASLPPTPLMHPQDISRGVLPPAASPLWAALKNADAQSRRKDPVELRINPSPDVLSESHPSPFF